MNSVTASEKARDWQLAFADEIDREKEDLENLEFFDEREKISRKQTRSARLEVNELQTQLTEWAEISDRTEKLERLDLDYWTDDDVAFCQQLRGSFFSPFILSHSRRSCASDASIASRFATGICHS